MMPIIKSTTLLVTILEHAISKAMTAEAPAMAPVITAAKPLTVSKSVEMLPLSSSITIATPRLAPLFIPNIDGPANGLLKAVCSIRPQTASDAPQSVAVIACGNLDSIMM